MLNKKQDRETRLTELVETHNLAKCLIRLNGAPYDSDRWKRALYHAMQMTGCGSSVISKIREALELP